MNDKTLVIVPTYNERENLPRLVPRVLAQRPEIEMLVVDDNSPDGTGQLADQLAAQYSALLPLPPGEGRGEGDWGARPTGSPLDTRHSTLDTGSPRFHVLHRQEKNGLGRAYCAGFQWALQRDYEFIFEMDGDFSHNPDDIPAFLEAAKDADLVLGSRYKNGIRVINWPLKRLMLSMGAGKYVRIITGLPI